MFLFLFPVRFFFKIEKKWTSFSGNWINASQSNNLTVFFTKLGLKSFFVCCRITPFSMLPSPTYFVLFSFMRFLFALYVLLSKAFNTHFLPSSSSSSSPFQRLTNILPLFSRFSWSLVLLFSSCAFVVSRHSLTHSLAHSFRTSLLTSFFYGRHRRRNPFHSRTETANHSQIVHRSALRGYSIFSLSLSHFMSISLSCHHYRSLFSQLLSLPTLSCPQLRIVLNGAEFPEFSCSQKQFLSNLNVRSKFP